MKELKERLLFVVLAIIVFRIGSYIPVPGLDPQRLHDLFNQQTTGILGLFNMFSGGALSRLTVFAMGIMPYVSASIIIQLFTAITPKLDNLKKEGESGRRKINQYTRYFTLILAAIQSLGMAKLLASSNIPLVGGISFYFITAITLTTGTMFLMWLGEQISEKGIGNGISLIIFSGIVSGLPSAIGSTIEMVRQGQLSMLTLIAIIILMFAVIAFVVFVERAQRKIKVNYTQKQQGNKMYAAQSTHLPLKINMAGVIPPIFASSIILFPASLTSWFSKSSGMHWLSTISLSLTSGFVHIAVFSVAIIFFSFFYTALVFNPKETAENLKKSGGYILGIRPGEQTANYIDGVMTRLTLAGALYLTLVCLMPEFMNTMWHLPFYFGGTSLLIIVVVIMDFISQVQAQVISQQYQSLMKKAKLKLK